MDYSPTWTPWKLAPDSDPEERYILVNKEDEEHPDNFKFATAEQAERYAELSDFVLVALSALQQTVAAKLDVGYGSQDYFALNDIAWRLKIEVLYRTKPQP